MEPGAEQYRLSFGEIGNGSVSRRSGWVKLYFLTAKLMWFKIAFTMKNKIGNKTGADKTTMTAREVAVLIEGLRSDFRVFGDELKTITKRIEGIETTTARAWAKLTEIDLRLIRVEKKVEGIDTKLINIDKRLTAVETPR